MAVLHQGLTTAGSGDIRSVRNERDSTVTILCSTEPPASSASPKDFWEVVETHVDVG
jgi:hypothetical protein